MSCVERHASNLAIFYAIELDSPIPFLCNIEKMSPISIEIIAVAYRRLGELKVFVQSILNQTVGNWSLLVIHDGEDEDFMQIMDAFQKQAPEQITFFCTHERYNDYGHSLREIGLRMATGSHVLLTNADNYYIPRFVEFSVDALNATQADVVLFDMIHSHDNPGGRGSPPYSFFPVQYQRLHIDIGAALIRRELAQAAGFSDKGHDGDASYFEQIAEIKKDATKVCKINSVMLVHN